MRCAFLSRLTIFCILALYATRAGWADPPDPPPSAATLSSMLDEDASPLDRYRLLQEAERQVTLRILERSVAFNPDIGLLMNVLDDLESRTGLEIIYDANALRELGIKPEIWPVDVEFGEKPIRPRDALDSILNDTGFTWDLRHGRVLITTIDKLNDRDPIKLYDITELAGSRPDYGAWINLIMETIEPQTWDTWGGPGVVREYVTPDKCFIAVSNNHFILEGIESLLNEFHRLNVPVYDRPLPSRIAPDGDFVEHQFKNRLDKSATFTTRVYDVSRLAGFIIRLEDITYLVQDVVEMNEWDPRGGQGFCGAIALEHGDFFVARQTVEMHEKIASFFAALEENDPDDPRIQAFEQWKVGWEERREEIRRREAEAEAQLRAMSRGGGDRRSGVPQPQRPPLPPRVRPEAGQGVTEEEVAEAALGANQFAFDFYNQFVAEKPDENLFFAPVGISTAFAIPYMASVGQTASQMRDVFHYPAPPEEIGPLYTAWALAPESSHIQKNDFWTRLTASPITMVNGLWIDSDFTFREQFSSDAERYFGATTNQLDFDAPGATNVINRWCDRHTNGLIPHIVDDVSDFDAYLANAIYFEAYWTIPFPRNETDWQSEFITFDREKLRIPLMSHEDFGVLYVEQEGTQIASLAYKHPEFEMILMLPPEGREAFAEFESSLDAEFFNKVVDDMRSQKVNLWLPRFEVETDIKDLNEQLISLGMPNAFNESLAEFPGVTKNNIAFWLDASVHKAVLKVSEEKTVAAATTGIGGMFNGHPVYSQPIDMRIDRPFLLAIRHHSTGSIIFMGRILAPKPFTIPDY